MPHLIAIESSESQRRQLREEINKLAQNGWPLTSRVEAANFDSWEKLFENTATPGLFATRELIVVESADSLGNFPDSLANYLEDDKADCIIILVLNGDSKIFKPVKDLITIIKPEAQIKPWDRPKWLMTLAKISHDAAQLLADSIDSQEELRSEINKLSEYAEGREININDVQNLSFDEGGRAQIIFLDSVCDNKPAQAARALKYLKSGPLLPVLAAICNRLRPAMIIAIFPGKSQDSALKAVGIDTAKKYNYALIKAKNALKNFGAEAIKKFMANSARLSYLEKTNMSENWQGFELILWELIAKI
ncbi:MAG: hypothetical protein IJT21_07775 [Synergistaceae bacterium]|nr:hypothetical protein [Synergistaceae bacterium]